MSKWSPSLRFFLSAEYPKQSIKMCSTVVSHPQNGQINGDSFLSLYVCVSRVCPILNLVNTLNDVRVPRHRSKTVCEKWPAQWHIPAVETTWDEAEFHLYHHPSVPGDGLDLVIQTWKGPIGIHSEKRGNNVLIILIIMLILQERGSGDGCGPARSKIQQLERDADGPGACRVRFFWGAS